MSDKQVVWIMAKNGLLNLGYSFMWLVEKIGFHTDIQQSVEKRLSTMLTKRKALELVFLSSKKLITNHYNPNWL